MNGAARSAGRVTGRYVTDSVLAEPLAWTGVTTGWNSYPVGHSTESPGAQRRREMFTVDGERQLEDMVPGQGLRGAQASWTQRPLGLTHAI